MDLKKWKPIYCGYPGYESYGRIFRITVGHILFLLCLVTPGTNWLIPAVLRLKQEIFRLTINNR